MPTPALFLHIQKTAGTSVIHVFSRYYENSMISYVDFHGHKSEDFLNTRFVSGHFGYSFAENLMKSRYSFTFLRNPIDRVLSFYSYCQRSNPEKYAVYKLAQQVSFDEFLDMGMTHPQIMPFIWNHQTWQIASGWGNIEKRALLSYPPDEMLNDAIANLDQFDYVGFTESFDADMTMILANLGIVEHEGIPKANTTENRPQKNELPSGTLDRLRRVTELDQLLYDHARLTFKNSRIEK